MNRKLYTVGYGGMTAPDFVERLVTNGVQTLVDIRELPISRKAGFAKTALRAHLEAREVSYTHLKWLGSPTSLRHEVRKSKDYAKFFRGLHRFYQQDECQAQLQELIKIARKSRACIMCYCPEAPHCHRSQVVKALDDIASFSIVHIGESRQLHAA